jgi:hypothetical protein
MDGRGFVAAPFKLDVEVGVGVGVDPLTLVLDSGFVTFIVGAAATIFTTLSFLTKMP